MRKQLPPAITTDGNNREGREISRGSLLDKPIYRIRPLGYQIRLNLRPLPFTLPLPLATISTSQVVDVETEPRPRGSGNARSYLVAAQSAMWGGLVSRGGLATRQKDAAGKAQILLRLYCSAGQLGHSN